jgi:hypothetical protein
MTAKKKTRRSIPELAHATMIALLAGGAVAAVTMIIVYSNTVWTPVLMLIGFLTITAGIVIAYGRHVSELDAAELADLPNRLAYLYHPAEPEPAVDPDDVLIYSWTVRQQPDGRFAALPFTEDGIEMWDKAVITDAKDSLAAWRVANEHRKELGWVR